MFKEIGLAVGYSVWGLGGALVGGAIGKAIDEAD